MRRALAVAAVGLILIFVVAFLGEWESRVSLSNTTGESLVITLTDARPRRRVLELPPGGTVALEAELPARLEARHHRAGTVLQRDLRQGEAVTLAPADFGDQPPVQVAASVRSVDLRAVQALAADEHEAGAEPRLAIDGVRSTRWRGLNVPTQGLSWALELRDPIGVSRVDVDLTCVTCGPVRLRLTLLRERLLPVAGLAGPGELARVRILDVVQARPDQVVATHDVEQVVGDGQTMTVALPTPVSGVVATILTIVRAPENVGFSEVRVFAAQ